ncbi:MAG TPA: hypothetical protein VFI33_18960, partial [Puia sp.]|nr:hypothetical protein [Puia sp.]
MQSVYELKKYKNSRDPELVKALKLYSQNIEPALRTDTKEIMHWLDKYNKTFEDSFYILGFYLNEMLIGFSEVAHFVEEKVIIVDYLVIDKLYRGNNTFHEFMEQIRGLLAEENLEYNYVVAEVGCFYEKTEPPENARHLIRLLKMSHFGVVKCNYYAPRLGINNHESEMRAIMMIYSANETKQIKKETFFQIVNAIYYKYYQRWYNEFLGEQDKIKYSRSLHELVSRMEKELMSKKFIEINGMSNLFPLQSESGNKNKVSKVVKVVTAV